MYLFLFFALPIFYFIFSVLKNQKKDVVDVANLEDSTFSKGFLIFFGIIISIIYCFVDFFTAYAYRNPIYSIFANFPYYFLSTIFVPILICAVILFLLSKDSWTFKLKSFTPILIGFYGVFLPYETISKNDNFDFFLLFVVPILFTTMIFLQEYALDLLVSVVEKTTKKIAILISVLIIILAITLPAIIYSIYYTKILFPFGIILTVLFVAGTISLYVFSEKIKSKLQ